MLRKIMFLTLLLACVMLAKTPAYAEGAAHTGTITISSKECQKVRLQIYDILKTKHGGTTTNHTGWTKAMFDVGREQIDMVGYCVGGKMFFTVWYSHNDFRDRANAIRNTSEDLMKLAIE